jgi:hypothetical protein
LEEGRLSRTASARAWAAGIALVAAGLLAPVAVVAHAVRGQALDRRAYVGTMTALEADPALRSAAAADLAHTAARPATGALLGSLLPKSAASHLEGPVAAAIEHLSERPLAAAFGSRVTRSAWIAGNRLLHDEALSLASRDSRLADAVAFFGGRPAVAGARRAKTLLDLVGEGLPLACLLLAGLGVALARRRRRALVLTGAGAGVALGLAELALLLAQPLLGARLTSRLLPAHAAGDLVHILLAPARTQLLLAAAAALALATVAAASRYRRSPRPVAAREQLPARAHPARDEEALAA